LIFCLRIYRAGYDENDAVIFLLILGGGMVVGGKILYALVNLKYLKYLSAADSFKEVLTVLNYVFGGLVFYGGLIGAALGGLIFLRIKRKTVPAALYLDNAALFAPIFHAFARVGCFFAGCCYGIESSFGFAVPDSVETSPTGIDHATRFPVQLLEALCNVGIALLIYFLMRKGIMRGKLIFVYLGVYSYIRFLDEFFRGDAIRGFIGPFSTSQFISILIEVFVLFMLFAYPRIKAAIQKKKASGLVFSIVALCLGIIGLIEGLSAWACNPSCGLACAIDMESEIGYILPGLLPVLVNVAGMVFGIIGRKKMAATGNFTAMGTVGMVLSIVGLAFAFIFFVVCSVVPFIGGEALEDALF